MEDEDLAGEYGFVKAHEARRRMQTEKRQLPCKRKSILATMFWQMAGDNVTHNGFREIILVC